MTSTIVTLEDRLEQTAKLVRKTKTVMVGIFSSLFLAEVLPTSVFTLIEFFFGPNGRLQDFSLDKLRCVVKVALAFVKAYQPDADVDTITKGIPLDTQGNPVNMEALLTLVEKAAKHVIEHLELDPKAEEIDQLAQP